MSVINAEELAAVIKIAADNGRPGGYFTWAMADRAAEAVLDAQGKGSRDSLRERLARLETALLAIADGYGPNHGSKYCRDVVLSALTVGK